MNQLRLLLSVLVLVGAASAQVFHGAALAPDGLNGWIVTIESTGVYHTSDGGAGWQPQSIATVRDFFDVFFLDESQGWTCGRVGDIWHTSNGGDTWARQNLGGPKFATRIQFIDGSHGWAAGGEAILMHSSNGGVEWQLEFFPNPPYPSSVVDFQGLSLIGADNGWLVAGRFPEGDSFWGGQGYIVHARADADTFIKQLVRLDTMYDFFGVDFIDSMTGWVVGGYDRTMRAAVLHTSNGGAGWTEQSLPTSAKYLRAVDFIDGLNGWACGRNGTIVHTSDGGANWESQYCPSDTTLFDIQFADAQHGLIAGNNIVLYTTDGGAHWMTGLGGIEERPRIERPQAVRLRAATNPARGRAVFEVNGIEGSALVVYNALGVSVRTLRGPVRSGSVVVWDGRDDSGRSVAGGLYLAQVRGAGQLGVARFVLLKE
jgi:photosystem II stability/assembly factor-like uncharacterized protein